MHLTAVTVGSVSEALAAIESRRKAGGSTFPVNIKSPAIETSSPARATNISDFESKVLSALYRNRLQTDKEVAEISWPLEKDSP